MAFTEYIEHAKITLLFFLLQIFYKPQAIHTCYSVINCRLYYIMSNSSDFCEILLQKKPGTLIFALFLYHLSKNFKGQVKNSRKYEGYFLQISLRIISHLICKTGVMLLGGQGKHLHTQIFRDQRQKIPQNC